MLRRKMVRPRHVFFDDDSGMPVAAVASVLALVCVFRCKSPALFQI